MTAPASQPWALSHRFDRAALPLANRHYSRQKPDSPQFVRAGYNVVLLTPDAGALWVSVYQPFCDHAWAGAWECTLFRNEARVMLSSDLIRWAVAATRAMWGDPPASGFMTTVDADKTRRKRDPGRCFRRAGWRVAGQTGNGKVVLTLAPEAFPAPAPPIGFVADLFGHTRRLKTRDDYPQAVRG